MDNLIKTNCLTVNCLYNFGKVEAGQQSKMLIC